MKPILSKSLYFIVIIFSLIVGSCSDDFHFTDYTIPDGEGTMSATVTFTPVTANSLGTTRTDGDIIQDINSLCVLVYTPKGDLIRKYTKSDLKNYDDTKKYTVDKDVDYDHDVPGAHTDETTTAKSTFSLPGLPFGQYKIYAVANMEDLADYDDWIKTEEGLKNIKLEWKAGNIALNNQMFGYFTKAQDMESEGFNAPVLLFDSNDMPIHAWLKRAASKVTVAFDPSGLNQGVKIYIRNVTIRDIPKTCLLGAVNTPKSVEELDNHQSTPYSEPTLESSDAIANSRLEYNSNGVITNSTEHTGNEKTAGFALDNSIRSAVPDSAHYPASPSLFFYENNQDPYLKAINPDYDKDPLYDKQQKPSGDKTGDGVGKPIRDEKDEEGKLTDLKDKVPYGTYIEVEAYYISSNPAKVGEGAIKYRFMLGKNVTYNYNAQRNYHFKVTLGFKGWANDPDWHIDYELPAPGLEVPPTFRVSYLYQQMSELPIRILGDCQWLTATITENNWAPYDSTSTNKYKVPPGVIVTQPVAYQFQWNEAAFNNPEYMTANGPKTQYGFLALHLPNRNTTAIEADYGPNSNDALETYYETYQEGERRFNEDNLSIGTHASTFDDKSPSVDDAYRVTYVLNDAGDPLPNQKTLMLPVWTRTKTLITDSGFSGNNPYEAFERKAVVHIAAVFKDGTRIEKDVEVFQVKRIVNPKGVWRAHDRTETFNVTLLEAVNSNAESNFQSFTSDGEWTAFIESQTNSGGFSIRPNGKTNGYFKNDTIHGYTGSTIDFAINFGNPVGEDESECAIVKVLYHGNQCLHKILIRKGYNAPMRMGGTTNNNGEYIGGRLWSSFSLYQATWISGNNDGVNDTYEAVLTKNPLMLGSMFRRGKQSSGIFVKNNQRPDLGPFMPPGNIPFIVGRKGTGTDGWTDWTWLQIGYRDDCWQYATNTTLGRTRGSRSYTLGSFYTIDDNGSRTNYRVPTYSDFKDLTDNSEFGFGVFYGSAATAPALTADDAYGLIDPENDGLFNLEYGMRGVVAYDKQTGNQLFFPMGRYGTGRRNNFVLEGNDAGVLRYGDVDDVLAIGPNNNNLYRPIPYNLQIQCGNVYWIDQYQYNVRTQYAATAYGARGCLGWDMNYFNFDFNPYTANNYRDACPIKFIIEE